MDNGSKFLISALGVVAVAGLLLTFQKNMESVEPSPTPVLREQWNLAGTIGGKHFLTLRLNREGDQLRGDAVNTRKETRSLQGELMQGGFLLLHEREGSRETGIFEGRRLGNGEIRGMWTTPDGNKWSPFYLKPVPKAETKNAMKLAGGHPE